MKIEPQLLQEGLPRARRLLKRADFQRGFQRGRRIHTRHLLVIARGTAMPYSRLGIAVSKKLGKAVLRNRLKRYIRESFRRHSGIKHLPRDVIVIVKNAEEDINFSCILQNFTEAMHRLA